MNICIIGAGPGGLATGYRLSKDGHQITIYEREAGWGGMSRTIRIGNQEVERFYHHIFTTDRDIIALIEELGLSSDLFWAPVRNGIFLNNKIYPFTSPGDLLMFKELPLSERLSMGTMLFKAKLIREWKDLDTVSAREWLVKNSGKVSYEKIWHPLLRSKFDNDADRISAAWMWNKLKSRGWTRSGNLSSESLGYLRGSFMRLYDKMANEIKERGGTISCSDPVKTVTPGSDKSLNVNTQKGVKNFDAVIVTASTREFLDITNCLPDWYIEKLRCVKYKANICVILELDSGLSPYYWISVAERDFPFVAVVEHTNLMQSETYGVYLLYLSRYIDENNELYLWEDSKVEGLFIASLKKIFPRFEEKKIINTHVSRARYAQPVMVTGYKEMVPGCCTPVENLYFLSMAQIYPEDRGQNYAIRSANKIAAIINQKNNADFKD